MSTIEYELYYWPSIPGRGEFPRLALEDAGARYRDVAREPEGEGGGVPALMRLLRGEAEGFRPFAPPILRHHTGERVVTLAQSAAILHYLGPRLSLVPGDEPTRAAAHTLQLTLADLVDEVHDTHHPVAPHLRYEEQTTEAKRRAAEFVKERIGKYLRWFESQLERGDGEHLVPGGHTYVDLSAFHVIEGLSFAFPRAVARLSPELPRLLALRDRVRARPRVAAYLASDRRLPFSDGIFRRYPDLDT